MRYDIHVSRQLSSVSIPLPAPKQHCKVSLIVQGLTANNSGSLASLRDGDCVDVGQDAQQKSWQSWNSRDQGD